MIAETKVPTEVAMANSPRAQSNSSVIGTRNAPDTGACMPIATNCAISAAKTIHQP